MQGALSFHHSPCAGAVHPSLTHHACVGVPNGAHSGCKAMGASYGYLGRCRARDLAFVVVLMVVIGCVEAWSWLSGGGVACMRTGSRRWVQTVLGTLADHACIYYTS